MTSAEKLLRDLVALPSVNPAFLPAKHPRAGEHRVAEFLADITQKAGLDVEMQDVFPGRSNVLVRLIPPGKVKCRIVLAPHLDTVDAASEEQMTPRVLSGRLHGRGACDTKGSVAAMLTALLELAAMGRPRETEIVFAGVVDEELGQAGSRALAASGLRADLAIVGEPTRLQVVTCHKGDMWLQLTTRGKSAHGARPELGKNAIHEMARIITWLDKSYTKVLRRRRHPLLGTATANIGTIAGGRQTNIVPDRCDITIDRRTLPGESDRAVRLELKKLLRQNGLVASLASTKAAPCAAMETSPELPLVSLFLKTARQRRPVGVDYFCDASVLSAAGIPSVVFGPGDIAQAHTADEWISLESLEQGKRLLVKLLQALP